MKIKKIARNYLDYLRPTPGTDLTIKKGESDFTSEEIETINSVIHYTMTSKERIVNLIRAIDYLVQNNINGDIVECGVWKGGSIMAALMTLLNRKDISRNIILYDTFEGMPQPDDIDRSFDGKSAKEAFINKDNWWERIKCFSTLYEVKMNIKNTGYPLEKVKYIKGKVEDTIPNDYISDNIALLRLDTDWYESTLHEMKYLYPKLQKGGIIIIDDYGHWQGCKKAVDEYLTTNKIRLFLSRIDYTCRIGIKT